MDDAQCLAFLKARDYCIEKSLASLRLSSLTGLLESRGIDHAELTMCMTPKVLTLGDTILLLWEKSPALGEHLIDLVLMFLDHFLLMSFHMNILFRGALTSGWFVFDGHNTAIGQAVADGASFYEAHSMPSVILAKSLGESLSHRLRRIHIVDGMRSGERGFLQEVSLVFCACKGDAVVKSEETRLVVSWPSALREMRFCTLWRRGYITSDCYFRYKLKMLGTKVKAPSKYDCALFLFNNATSVYCL